jgi:hypothetical protein
MNTLRGPRMKPARQLELMVRELKEVKVDQLSHRDWLAVLNLLDIFAKEVNKLGTKGSFGVLITIVQRAQRSSLPVPPRDTEDPAEVS